MNTQHGNAALGKYEYCNVANRLGSPKSCAIKDHFDSLNRRNLLRDLSGNPKEKERLGQFDLAATSILRSLCLCKHHMRCCDGFDHVPVSFFAARLAALRGN